MPMNAAPAPQPHSFRIGGVSLTCKSPDDELQAVLAKDPGLLERSQIEATARYREARNLRNAPFARIDADWQGFVGRAKEAAARAPRHAPNSPADWESRVAQLRLALAAIEHFTTFLARWRGLTDVQQQQEFADDRSFAVARDYQRAIASAPRAVAAPPPAALDIVRALAQRGITLGIGKGGTVTARPAELLTDSDRNLIRASKDALVAALADSEVVA